MEGALVFPINMIQISKSPIIQKDRIHYLIEDPVFFGMDPQRKLKYHKNKLVIYRASMKYYYKLLKDKGYKVKYIEYPANDLFRVIKRDKIVKAHFIDPVDEVLSHRITSQAKRHNIVLKWYESPLFLTNTKELTEYDTKYRPNPDRFNHKSFYIWQRKRLQVMLSNNKPEGGKWSYDKLNRQKLPDNVQVPKLPNVRQSQTVKEAKDYVNTRFKDWYGTTEYFNYPTNHATAKKFLKSFLDKRLQKFGLYYT